MIDVSPGREYKVTLKRGRTFKADRPIVEEGRIIGWWMRGDDGMSHAYRLADIKEEVNSGALR